MRGVVATEMSFADGPICADADNGRTRSRLHQLISPSLARISDFYDIIETLVLTLLLPQMAAASVATPVSSSSSVLPTKSPNARDSCKSKMDQYPVAPDAHSTRMSCYYATTLTTCTEPAPGG